MNQITGTGLNNILFTMFTYKYTSGLNLLLMLLALILSLSAAAYDRCIVINAKKDRVIEKMFQGDDGYHCLGWSVFHKATIKQEFDVFFFIVHPYRDTVRVKKLPDSFDVTKYCDLGCLAERYGFPKKGEPLVVGRETSLPLDSIIICTNTGNWLYTQLITLEVYVRADVKENKENTQRGVLNLHTKPLYNVDKIVNDSIDFYVHSKLPAGNGVLQFKSLYLVYKNRQQYLFYKSHEPCRDCSRVYSKYFLFNPTKGILKFYSTYYYFPQPNVPSWSNVYQSNDRHWFE